MSTFQPSLDVRLGEYHQVVTLTQAGIADGLHKLDWPETKIDIHLRGRSEFLTGALLRPSIELDPANPHRGWLRTRFAAGGLYSVLLMTEDHKTLYTVKVPIDDWTIAWPINLSQRPDQNKELNDYSPSRVLSIFTPSPFLTADLERSSIPMTGIEQGAVWAARDILAHLFAQWTEDQNRAGNNVFGRPASTLPGQIGGSVPSLPARQLAFQTYPYFQSGQQHGSEQNDHEKALTGFCFLNMLQPMLVYDWMKLPDLPQSPLGYSGNLVWTLDGSLQNTLAGSLAINADTFWDRIDQTIQLVSDQLLLVPRDISLKAEEVIDEFRKDFVVQIGTKGAFIPRKKVAVQGNLFTLVPGTSEIRVEGGSSYRFEWHIRLARTWWNQGGWPCIGNDLSWKYIIKLGTTSDGKLSMAVKPDSLHVSWGSGRAQTTFGYPPESYNGWRGSIDQHMLDNMTDKLNTALSWQMPLDLPGMGQYDFGKAIFSKEGDLLVPLLLKS
ncbi:hypothetical protein OC834_004998 [Tilletia horrida]|nr:hypothetical protein OC834_004998 [Tilletia horrida]